MEEAEIEFDVTVFKKLGKKKKCVMKLYRSSMNLVFRRAKYDDRAVGGIGGPFPVTNCLIFCANVEKSRRNCLKLVTVDYKRSVVFQMNKYFELEYFVYTLTKFANAQFKGSSMVRKKGLFSKLKKSYPAVEEPLEGIVVRSWRDGHVRLWLKSLCELTGLRSLHPSESKMVKFVRTYPIGQKLLKISERKDIESLGLGVKVESELLYHLEALKRQKVYVAARVLMEKKFQQFGKYTRTDVALQEKIDVMSDLALFQYNYLTFTGRADDEDYGCWGGGMIHPNRVKIKLLYVENPQSGLHLPLRDNLSEKVKCFTEVPPPQRIPRKTLRVVYYLLFMHFKNPNSLPAQLPTDVVRFQIVPFLLPAKDTWGDDLVLYSALLVGPILLEFTDSGLCIPKYATSYYYDVDTLNVPRDGVESGVFFENLASAVYKYNCMHMYEREPESKNDMLRSMGVQCDFGGALGISVENMRKKGCAKMNFEPCKEFREFFGIREKKWKFSTHMELDKFSVKIREQCLDVFNCFSSEWCLLKAYDRVYWRRHLQNPESKKFKPLPPEDKDIHHYRVHNTGCPFGHPQATK